MMTGKGEVRILVVDDDPNFRRLMRAILSAISTAEIAEAGDGHQALQVMRDFAPTLILVDWHMQPMGGAEFNSHIRTHTDSPNPLVPIVVVTGHAESGLATQIRDVGADDFVVKPVSPRTVLGYVRSGDYMGPDRRRRTQENLPNDRRRPDGLSAKVDG